MSDPARPAAPPAEDATPLEEAAQARLGLRRWDRVAVYRETAAAATDSDLPFWTVLLLSGAIATLGLALDQTAVVIGAMLIAPLLGPLLGLSLALAVGDGRLVVQTALTIVLGALGVIAVAAVLTVALPFQDVTAEIAARTRPTTLDLAIAVASGLAGAVVTLAREERLSASIPGVAIAVALIPPLGVAGFGVGSGWQWPLIHGSLLLFGANLGGIVLSGLLAFLLVGMHRADVVAAAQAWHRENGARGLSARIERAPVFARLRVFDAPWARVLLVLAFVGAVAVPLSTSLALYVREIRVRGAVDAAAGVFEAEGRSFVLGRRVTLGDGAARVRLRVATTEGYGAGARAAFERAASRAAGEPVALTLEQVFTADGDLPALAQALPLPEMPEPAPTPAGAIAALRARLDDALAGLAVPDSVRVLGGEVRVGSGGTRLRVGYAAPRRLPRQAEAMLARQAAAALGLAPGRVTTEAAPLAPLALPADSAALARLAGLAARYPALALDVAADSAVAARARRVLLGAGASPARLRVGPAPSGAPARARLIVAPDSTGAPL